MPRPPRTKVASSTTRVTKSKTTLRNQTTKTVSKQSKRATEVIKSFSDDSDGLVTKSTRSRRGIRSDATTDPAAEAEFAMAGALPAEENIMTHLSKIHTPVSKPSKRTRTTRDNVQTSAKTSSPVVLAQNSAEAEVEEDLPYEGESSGFGDLTFSSLGSNSPAHGTRPPSVIKVGATPAHERSVLALTNFKRRARQPSLLRMMQQTTDVEDNDQDAQDDLDNTDNFDFDDFLPQAESTPLNVRRNAAESRIPNNGDAQISSSGSRGTKRKLSPVIQVPRSLPPFSPPSGADVVSSRSRSPSLSDVLPSREAIVEQTQDDPELMSETYAPPLSSSPVREVSTAPPSPPQARPRRKGRSAKTPIQDPESEDEETDTPVKTRRNAKKKNQPSISTAQLTDLLPRRRARLHEHDEFDLTSSDNVEPIDSDQDELQMPDRRNRNRPGTANPSSPRATKKSTRGKKTAPSKTAHRVSRTYSRRISSDKENDEANRDEEGDAEVSAIEHSEKLAAIRKKFEEVDAFELEFETVDTTTSSSPFR